MERSALMYQFSWDYQYVDDLMLNFEKSFFRRGVSDKQQVEQFPTNIRCPDMLGVDVLVYRFGHKYVFDSNFAKRKRSFRIH